MLNRKYHLLDRNKYKILLLDTIRIQNELVDEINENNMINAFKYPKDKIFDKLEKLLY